MNKFQAYEIIKLVESWRIHETILIKELQKTVNQREFINEWI